MIDPATEAAIDGRLDQLEQLNSAEIAVVTVQSLNGMTATDYANRLFKEWGVGQARVDNGLLVLVGIDDREMAIEVGYGLEGVLPDGLAGQVIRENFTPKFKAGDYSGGIQDGVQRLIGIVQANHILTPEERQAINEAEGVTLPYWIGIPFFGIFVTIGFGMMGIGVRTKTGFPLLFGSLFGGMPLLMSLGFMFTIALFTLLPWAIFMFVTGYRLGGRERWRDAFRDTGRGGSSGSSGGWTMGTSSSSGSSGSSGSSSSSSFGGGSSGGGGASGRW
ncbi:MAG: TPM domain-containing protein [Cyanobacteria bacterium]|nr:TPM domain-containing protein [Cyanobacteriota bacterium]